MTESFTKRLAEKRERESAGRAPKRLQAAINFFQEAVPEKAGILDSRTTLLAAISAWAERDRIDYYPLADLLGILLTHCPKQVVLSTTAGSAATGDKLEAGIHKPLPKSAS